jgi:transcriptional regulator with XRE-family HTH domain
MKQAELASKLGITQAALSGWENNKFNIDNENLVRLCEIFNVTADYLLGRDEQIEKPVITSDDGLSDIQRQNKELLKRLTPEQELRLNGFLQLLKDMH